jgi:hypothetical protein
VSTATAAIHERSRGGETGHDRKPFGRDADSKDMQYTSSSPIPTVDWFAVEHHRLHIIETWPEGPRRQSALAAVRSALHGLLRAGPDLECFDCYVCMSDRKPENRDS